MTLPARAQFNPMPGPPQMGPGSQLINRGVFSGGPANPTPPLGPTGGMPGGGGFPINRRVFGDNDPSTPIRRPFSQIGAPGMRNLTQSPSLI